MSVPKVWQYPGYLFPEGLYKGEVISEGYRVVVKSDDYEGEAILDKEYAGKLNLTQSRVIKDLVVIGYRDGYLHLAKEDYLDKLITYYVQNGKGGIRLRNERFLHWEKDWANACSVSCFEKAFQWRNNTAQHYGRRWFELKGPTCRLPIQKIAHLQDLKGEALFFPAFFYDTRKIRINSKVIEKRLIPRTLYKTDNSDIKMPLYYKGMIKKEDNSERAVNICLHGFPSPSKWHYGVLKHMLGISGFKEDDNPCKLWEAFEGDQIGDFDKSVFKDCHQNNEKDSCDEKDCLKNKCFSNVHKHIREYCQRYLKKAVSFFKDVRIKDIIILEKKQCNPKKVVVECVRRVENTEFGKALGQENLTERNEVLILNGSCFDWDSQEPTIHLFILTLYAGDIARGACSLNIDKGFNLFEEGNLIIL